MKLETITDFDDLIFGAKILGCGGGGEESLAWSRVNYLFENNLSVHVISPDDLPIDALICISGMVGGRSTPATQTHVSGLERIDPWPMFSATKLLQTYLQEDFHSLISTEIGAGNFLVPILVASRFGISVIDGDLCGRAKPEISISTTNLADIPITPLAIASTFGDELILKKAITDQRAERLARELAVLSGGSVGVARCPARWSDYRRAVIPNTMSLAQNLGAAIRHSREKNQNPIETILEVLDGKLLFSGRVIDCTITDHGGFVLGELYLKDIDDNQLKIWFKNEYLISWFNGKPFITAPDLLCVVDSETGEGLSPWADNFSHLRAVSVIGKKNHPHWYTPKGLALFGPRHFGFDFDYNDFLIAK